MDSTAPLFRFLARTDLDSILKCRAGDKIFRRGMDYFINNRARDLALAKNNTWLLGTVDGSRDYAAALFLDDDGVLDGACDCPCEGFCKHIVALALEARKCLQENKSLPPCGELDFRPRMLEAVQPESAQAPNLDALPEALAKLPREILLDLLLQACELDRDVLLLCAAKADPGNIGLQAILDDARMAVGDAARVPDYYDDYGSLPDYRAIAKKLRAVAAAGKPDIALALATEVFSSCAHLIEVYDNEGEVTDDAAEVAEAAVAFLGQVEWSQLEKIVWAINAVINDDFGYCECLKSYLHEINDPSAWADTADYLATRTGKPDFWRKSGVTEFRKLALEKAGRHEDLLRLYEKEARESGNYLKIIDYLLGQGKQKDAERWIRSGLENTRSPFDATRLLERLIRLREKEGDHDAAIALMTEIFVLDPNVAGYEACRDAATESGLWDALKPLLLRYLSEGKIPWLDKTWPYANKGSAKPARDKFPIYNLLVEIALRENRPLDALAWHDRQKGSGTGYGFSEIRLADDIRDVAPERAIAIWRSRAEDLIAATGSRSYLEAGKLLEKMIAVAEKTGTQKDMRAYLGSLRDLHKRKKNFLRILDAVERGEKLPERY